MANQTKGREEGAEHADYRLDFHPSVQQIPFVDHETGECGEQRLIHSDGEAESFYRELRQREISVRVGMEATGNTRWFERLMAELGFELWIGDPRARDPCLHKLKPTSKQSLLTNACITD
jgi:hypothetical protein